MNTVVKVVGGLVGIGVLAVAVVAGVAAMRPDTLSLSRTMVVDASPEDMRPFARDLREWNRWSPWADIDPDLTNAFSDPSAGEGAWYTWEGNADAGRGRMTVTTDQPGRVVHAIHFDAPMEGDATSTITWEAVDGGTRVTWAFEQPADFPTKAADLLLDIEGMVGKDYDRGLERLRPLVEQAATMRQTATEAPPTAPDPGPAPDTELQE